MTRRIDVSFVLACTAAAHLIQKLQQDRLRRIVTLACASSLCVYGYGAHRAQRSLAYRGVALAGRGSKGSGQRPRLMNYGLTQMAKGDTGRAYEYFERARLLVPIYSLLEINLTVVAGIAHPAGLRRSLQQDCCRIRPEFQLARNNPSWSQSQLRRTP